MSVPPPSSSVDGAKLTELGSIPNVYPLYTQGRTLLKIGVLPGYDLTHEAAFAKLLWLVSRKDLTFGKKQELFQVPVAGEMSI
jgi:lysophospholipase